MNKNELQVNPVRIYNDSVPRICIDRKKVKKRYAFIAFS